MTKEIRNRIESKIKHEEMLLAEGICSTHRYNCLLVGMLNGLLIADAITEDERIELYLKYRKKVK